MKFLKPNSVSGEILNLLDEAKEKVIIVSPYCKFHKWYRLVNKIKELETRNVAIEFYIRDNEPESYEQVMAIGIQPFCIPNLHSKLYLNEKYGIVTSMNLLLSSEINSIELGYKTETKEEYDELIEFYETYLNKNIPEKKEDFDWLAILHEKLSEKYRIKIFINEGDIGIKTSSNNYHVFIWNNKGINKMRITGILSGNEFEYSKTHENEIVLENLSLEIIEGKNGYLSSFWGTFDTALNSTNIHDLQVKDALKIIDPIIDFIFKIEEIKDYCYVNRKSFS